MNIELPKDAQGREIPLDTKVLYSQDGTKHRVIKWEFYPNNNIPWVVTLETGNTRTYHCPDCVYLTPPDSWEKLEEDLDRVAASCSEGITPVCVYTRQPCAVCKFHSSEDCTSAMCADIASRIRKLRGEDE